MPIKKQKLIWGRKEGEKRLIPGTRNAWNKHPKREGVWPFRRRVQFHPPESSNIKNVLQKPNVVWNNEGDWCPLDTERSVEGRAPENASFRNKFTAKVTKAVRRTDMLLIG